MKSFHVNAASFAEMVIEFVPLTTVVSWAGSNRGSFVLCR